MRKALLTIFTLVLLCFAAALFADDAKHVPKLETKAKIDGILDEAVWQKALPLSLDFETTPGENIAALVKYYIGDRILDQRDASFDSLSLEKFAH